MAITATPLSPTNRYYLRGTREVLFVPTIADQESPTLTELNAGTNLTAEVMSTAGFSDSVADSPVPDWGSTFTANVPGERTVDPSSITFYADNASDDVRTLLPQGTTGFIVIFPEGSTTGTKMDVWPVRVSSMTKPNDQDNGQIVVSFSITRVPSTDVAIPTS